MKLGYVLQALWPLVRVRLFLLPVFHSSRSKRIKCQQILRGKVPWDVVRTATQAGLTKVRLRFCLPPRPWCFQLILFHYPFKSEKSLIKHHQMAHRIENELGPAKPALVKVRLILLFFLQTYGNKRQFFLNSQPRKSTEASKRSVFEATG